MIKMIYLTMRPRRVAYALLLHWMWRLRSPAQGKKIGLKLGTFVFFVAYSKYLCVNVRDLDFFVLISMFSVKLTLQNFCRRGQWNVCRAGIHTLCSETAVRNSSRHSGELLTCFLSRHPSLALIRDDQGGRILHRQAFLRTWLA